MIILVSHAFAIRMGAVAADFQQIQRGLELLQSLSIAN
jgi:hypothetical protein